MPCTVPRLWGLSLFGTSLRVYYCDVATGAITPTFEEPPSPGVLRNFLERGWDMDILSQEGFETMKEISLQESHGVPILDVLVFLASPYKSCTL